MPINRLQLVFKVVLFMFTWRLLRGASLVGIDHPIILKRLVEGNSSRNGSTWEYSESVKWPTQIARCGGEHQSPINIQPSGAIEVAFPKFSFGHYDKVFPESVSNNGHTGRSDSVKHINAITCKVSLQISKYNEDDELPFIEDGGLSDRYIFYQLHFHWGSADNIGSEHRIANQRYPAELHIVHYGQKYDNFTEASKHPDGLAVLAVLIEMEKRDNIAFRHIEHFDQITRPNATGKGDSITNLTNPIALEDLIPDNPSNFYRYNGSLTTPLCNEAVIWTVFDTPIALSERQMGEFRQLFDTEGRHLTNNFRPVQSLQGRVVLHRSENSTATQ